MIKQFLWDTLSAIACFRYEIAALSELNAYYIFIDNIKTNKINLQIFKSYKAYKKYLIEFIYRLKNDYHV